MGTRVEVPITGSVLEWAIREAGYSDAEAAAKAKVPLATLREWIAERSRPSKTEFNKLVEAVRRPSAIFFLPEPPLSAGLPTNFRRSPGGHELSPAAIREVRKARRIQQAVSWLISQAEASASVDLPRVSWIEIDPVQAGERARRDLGLSLVEQASWKDASSALREWRAIYDEMGILTFSLQLGTREIRGFSAWDDRAPMMAVNTAYVEGARIFTMAHEFAHLISRTDSTCYDWVNPDAPSGLAVERWCEKFAAAFLLPPVMLRSYLSYQFAISGNETVEDFDTVWKLSRKLKVSARAMAIALIDLRLAPKSIYGLVEENADAIDRRPRRENETGGPAQSAPVKRLSQYGGRSTRMMLEAIRDGALGERDVADYLALSTGGLRDLASLLDMRPPVSR